jgi:ferredoxin
VPQTCPVEVVTPQGTFRVDVPADAYLLDALRQAGLDLPSSCLQGWCLTCAERLLDGEVDQTDAVRYFPEDRAAGFALLCSAKPRSPPGS